MLKMFKVTESSVQLCHFACRPSSSSSPRHLGDEEELFTTLQMSKEINLDMGSSDRPLRTIRKKCLLSNNLFNNKNLFVK